MVKLFYLTNKWDSNRYYLSGGGGNRVVMAMEK